jgi:uncharacterized protein
LKNQECRGADTPEELHAPARKDHCGPAAMDADVVGLIEIENHPGDVPTADLVSGLNDLLGAGTYDYIETGAIGTDAIRQAIIYKPAPSRPSAIMLSWIVSDDPASWMTTTGRPWPRPSWTTTPAASSPWRSIT